MVHTTFRSLLQAVEARDVIDIAYSIDYLEVRVCGERGRTESPKRRGGS